MRARFYTQQPNSAVFGTLAAKEPRDQSKGIPYPIADLALISPAH